MWTLHLNMLWSLRKGIHMTHHYGYQNHWTMQLQSHFAIQKNAGKIREERTPWGFRCAQGYLKGWGLWLILWGALRSISTVTQRISMEEPLWTFSVFCPEMRPICSQIKNIEFQDCYWLHLLSCCSLGLFLLHTDWFFSSAWLCMAVGKWICTE